MTTTEMRELDAWVAEHVMGYVWTTHRDPVKPYINKRWLLAPETFKDLGGGKGQWIKAKMTEGILAEDEPDMPHYTTTPPLRWKCWRSATRKITFQFAPANRQTVTSFGFPTDSTFR